MSNDSLFVLFVDLKKAYDSVPRDAVWNVLEKWGAPPKLVGLVRSFHEGMQATVRIGGDSSMGFDVRKGLRQGCTIAPSLFNIYFGAVVNSWRVSVS